MTKPRICPVCKERPLSVATATRCIRCYYTRRGVPSRALPNAPCIDCGGPCSKRATRCFKCSRLYQRSEAKAERDEADAHLRQPLRTYDEAWARWQECIHQARDRYRGAAKARTPDGRTRVLVVPDLHVPFHEPEMLAAMLARESKRTDLAVLIGDVGDCYSLSRFSKHERVPYADEWAAVTLILETFSELLPAVRIIVGNHDARLRKALAAQLTPDMVDAITAMTPSGTLCPITALARRFENVSVASHPVPGTTHAIDWLTVVGDAVLAHPEKYSRTPGAALRVFEEWLADNSDALGLDAIRLLVMGHTHTLAVLPWRASSMLVECGCLCKTAGYMTQAKIGGRPQRRGYVTFEQVDGRTDLNSVKLHWFDVEDGAPWQR